VSAGPTTVEITILVDNHANAGLLSEHGFSAWIEAGDQRILFDTGQGSAITANADILGIDLRGTDAVVLSHGHYDHTGGLALILERAPSVRIYGHPATTGPRFAIRDGAAKSIAMPESAREALEGFPDRVNWVTQPIELASGIGLTGPIRRLTDYEDTGGPFFTDAGGVHADPIADDLAMWISTERGLVLVVGCSHSGVINTLHHALDVSGQSGVRAVLGGFHLVGASQTRIERTCDALKALDPELIVPCHCTGTNAVDQLRRRLGDRVAPGFAGTVYSFQNSACAIGPAA
jgi:7,8-dihydropterin-6-yl-methyl-4-(beta-D-ribofuranosyl)aminobenzene 5'-phosphate synthase